MVLKSTKIQSKRIILRGWIFALQRILTGISDYIWKVYRVAQRSLEANLICLQVTHSARISPKAHPVISAECSPRVATWGLSKLLDALLQTKFPERNGQDNWFAALRRWAPRLTSRPRRPLETTQPTARRAQNADTECRINTRLTN